MKMKECDALLTVEAGKERQILDKLRSMEGIESAYILFGEYDIIAKMKSEKDFDAYKCRDKLAIDGVGIIKIFEVIDVVV